MNHLDLLKPNDTFARRHLGPQGDKINRMLAVTGAASLDVAALSDAGPVRFSSETRRSTPPNTTAAAVKGSKTFFMSASEGLASCALRSSPPQHRDSRRRPVRHNGVPRLDCRPLAKGGREPSEW